MWHSPTENTSAHVEDCDVEDASCETLGFLEQSVVIFLNQPPADASDAAVATACLQAVKNKQALLSCSD